MKQKLQTLLKPKRYEHSIGVCNEAVELSKKYGADDEKAYIAGLLHDCAKGYDIKTQIKLCNEYGVTLDKVTLACPAVIHAPLGAEVAKREFGITDNEILNAIRLHTVAGENMTLLDKIIYIADMIEPLRDYRGVELLRTLAYENIDNAFEEGLRQSITFNLQKQSLIHPQTLYAWNDVLINTKKKV